MRAILILVLIPCILTITLALRPSFGCGHQKPPLPHAGHHHRFDLRYNDANLGEIYRHYILQIPNGYSHTNEYPTPLIMDVHGYTGSAAGQVGLPWMDFALNNNIIMLWPDGYNDQPHGYRSWNCSRTDGPLGPPCDLNRTNWEEGEIICHESCPTCDPLNSCDWSSCTDDIGFIEHILEEITHQWCVDLDHMHYTGISNGGMLAWYIAAKAVDALGFATFNPVAASPLIGFGDPPSEINFSILDYHGLNDQTIPYSEETSFGKGPHGSVVSSDGYYYVNKVPYLQEWSKAMICEEEQSYQTPYDGIKGFECFKRKCDGGKDIVRCAAEYGHNYPLWGHHGAAAEIAWNFMKNHPRTS